MATNNNPQPAVKWSATGATPRVAIVGGQPVNGHTVTFETVAGNRGEVFVPDSVQSVDNARELIARQAEYLDGLATLRG